MYCKNNETLSFQFWGPLARDIWPRRVFEKRYKWLLTFLLRLRYIFFQYLNFINVKGRAMQYKMKQRLEKWSNSASQQICCSKATALLYSDIRVTLWTKNISSTDYASLMYTIHELYGGTLVKYNNILVFDKLWGYNRSGCTFKHFNVWSWHEIYCKHMKKSPWYEQRKTEYL